MTDTHAQEELDGLPPFGALERMRSLTAADVVERQRELCRDDSFGVAIVAS